MPTDRELGFGRDKDIETLFARVRLKGLTAVVGRPQMGKSWLLTELARRLSTDHDPVHLVGFARSYGQTSDLLLRAIIDLYQRWLADAGCRQKAQMVWTQQKPDLLPGVFKAVSRIFGELDIVAKPIVAAVDEAINGLVQANQTLATGGIQLPTLQYDQARDLIRGVAAIGERPIVLVLDQWEQSPDPAFEAKTLQAFLHQTDEWPLCHIILALRPEEPAFTTVSRLVASRPGPAKIHELEEMDLRGTSERMRLARYIREAVPAAEHVEENDILDLVAGYPGVLYQWTSAYQRQAMTTEADLRHVADDAQEYRFGELPDILENVSRDHDQRRLAIRLALLPLVNAPDAWPALQPYVLDGLDAALIDALKLAKALETADPPSFGHAKRWEAAQGWMLEHLTAGMRAEAENLIFRLAAPVCNVDPAVQNNIAALLSLLPTSQKLQVANAAQAICRAAATLTGDATAVDDMLIDGLRHLPASGTGAALIAMGLFNTLLDAKQEDDLGRRDALLDALRALADRYPDDTAVREWLAKGLFNTLNHAKREDNLGRRDALLDALRALADRYPDDTAVREWLAKGLFNTLFDAKEEGDHGRRDALLDALRDLAARHPDDPAVRTVVAMGLVTALGYTEEEGDLGRRDALLGALRTLADRHNDTVVREWLAMGLFNTLEHAKQQDDLGRRDALLDELRALATRYPDHPAVREWLAKGLFNTLKHAKQQDDHGRRDALLDELRALAARHTDAAVRAQLAMGLLNMLNDAKQEDDLGRRDALLDDLRALAARHPDDPAVRELLGKGLFNTLNHAKQEDDLGRRDALLDDLRALAARHPDDPAVREPLAMGLFSTLNHAKDEDELGRRDALLVELRALAARHPDDPAVREWLAMGLVNTLVHAKQEDDLGRRDVLLVELRALAAAHPDVAELLESADLGDLLQ
jgi:hypothetical protein